MRFQLIFSFILLIQFNSLSQKENKSWIDNLNEGDSLRIEFRSSGCFHGYDETVIFFRKDNHFFAASMNDTVVLDSAAMERLRLFEDELGKQRRHGCTTTDSYKVFLNDKKLKKTTDGTCGWRGYRNYISPLFNNEE